MVRGKWSDLTKWWMGLISAVLTFGLFTFVSLWWLDGLDTKTQLRRHVLQTQVARDYAALDDFRESSFAYKAVAADAFKDSADGATRKSSDEIQRFQDEVNDNYERALEILEARFFAVEKLGETELSLQSSIKSLRVHSKEMHSQIQGATASGATEEFGNAARAFKGLRMTMLKDLEMLIEAKALSRAAQLANAADDASHRS